MLKTWDRSQASGFIDWDQFWIDAQKESDNRNLPLMPPKQAMEVYREITEELIEKQLADRVYQQIIDRVRRDAR